MKKIDEIREWSKVNVSYRKMLPDTSGLTVTKTIRDILEDTVDEKYYMSEDKTRSLIEKLTNLNTKIIDVSQMRREGVVREYEDISPTLAARDYKEPRMVGMIDIRGNESIRRVYDPNGISPTLTTMGGGHREPKILQRPRGYNTTEFSFIIDDQDRINKKLTPLQFSPTPRAQSHGNEAEVVECKQRLKKMSENECNYRIRKLTPLECWRLQGFPDESFRKAEAVNSNTQLYKQAGNSVTVNVVEKIAEKIV